MWRRLNWRCRLWRLVYSTNALCWLHFGWIEVRLHSYHKWTASELSGRCFGALPTAEFVWADLNDASTKKYFLCCWLVDFVSFLLSFKNQPFHLQHFACFLLRVDLFLMTSRKLEALPCCVGCQNQKHLLRCTTLCHGRLWFGTHKEHVELNYDFLVIFH